MHSGINLVQNGLSFAYDTGYGFTSGNNNTVYYQGRPTTNLVSDPVNMSGWSSYSSGNDGTFLTEFGTVGYKINRRNTWNGIAKGVSLPSAGTYTISAWFRIRGKSSGNNGINVYTSGGGISDTAAGGNDGLFGEWQRISMTRTYTGTSFTFYIISWGGTSGTDWSSWDVTMPQVEAGSILTPFANGTRSSTQALINTKRTSTINLANVSYNGNGQPVFDGSDDYIDSGYDLSWNNSKSVSIEFIIKRGGTGGGIMGKEYPNWEWAFYLNSAGIQLVYWDTGGSHGNGMDHGTTQFMTDTNAYYHVVYTWDGGTSRWYVNGALNTTHTAGNPSTNQNRGNNVMIGGHSYVWADSYANCELPVVRFYDNKQLSATEAYQNYLAYRKRFNLS